MVKIYGINTKHKEQATSNNGRRSHHLAFGTAVRDGRYEKAK